MRLPLVIIVLLLPVDSALAQRKSGRCTGDATDSATMALAPIYRDCEVDRPAKVRSQIRISFQPHTSGMEARCYKTEVEFVVDTAGHPEPDDVKVVSGNSPELAEAVQASLPTLRYDPAQLGGRPVRQRVRFPWSVATRVVLSRGGAPPNPGRPPLC